jgi:hypothetical protein
LLATDVSFLRLFERLNLTDNSFTDDVAINDVSFNEAGIHEVVKQVEALGRRSVGIVGGEL